MLLLAYKSHSATCPLLSDSHRFIFIKFRSWTDCWNWNKMEKLEILRTCLSHNLTASYHHHLHLPWPPLSSSLHPVFLKQINKQITAFGWVYRIYQRLDQTTINEYYDKVWWWKWMKNGHVSRNVSPTNRHTATVWLKLLQHF